MSVLGYPLPDEDCDTATAIERLRQQARQFQQLAAMAITKNTAEMLTHKSRDYSAQAARLKAKFITSRPNPVITGVKLTTSRKRDITPPTH